MIVKKRRAETRKDQIRAPHPKHPHASQTDINYDLRTWKSIYFRFGGGGVYVCMCVSLHMYVQVMYTRICIVYAVCVGQKSTSNVIPQVLIFSHSLSVTRNSLPSRLNGPVNEPRGRVCFSLSSPGTTSLS